MKSPTYPQPDCRLDWQFYNPHGASPDGILLAQVVFLAREMDAAAQEHAAMLQTKGSLVTVWDTPRRYFVPEPETLIPFLHAELAQAIGEYERRVQAMGEGPMKVAAVQLMSDITLAEQYFEVGRREVFPERIGQ